MPTPETAAQKSVLANFDLGQCQQMDTDIYKCPAVDKPVCHSSYSGSIECIRIGKNGSVYVAGPRE
jgi:hypothetical protein